MYLNSLEGGFQERISRKDESRSIDVLFSLRVLPSICSRVSFHFRLLVLVSATALIEFTRFKTGFLNRCSVSS